jgi:hypothetical protein
MFPGFGIINPGIPRLIPVLENNLSIEIPDFKVFFNHALLTFVQVYTYQLLSDAPLHVCFSLHQYNYSWYYKKYELFMFEKSG